MNKLPVIFIIDSSLAITGAFTCARNLARALVGRAHITLVIPHDSNLKAADTSDFFRVYRLPIVPLRRHFWSILFYIPSLFLTSIILRIRLYLDGASILVVNDFYMMQGVLCRLLGFNGRIFTWIRISPTSFGKFGSWMLLKLSANLSDCMIAVSKYIQCETKFISSILLYDGIDLSPYSYDRCFDTKFVFVGNYISGKGQDKAIEGFFQIASEFPNISLEFYGGDMGLSKNMAYRSKLMSRVDELRLVDRINFYGFVPASEIYTHRTFVALNFSDSESFSMAVLEAQAAGCPVIATRSGGPEEIIVDSQTGFLVPVGDINAMATAMRSLATDPVWASLMGKAARERARTNFSFERYQSEILRLFSLS